MKQPIPTWMVIRQARKKLGLTQKALAKKAKISAAYIRTIEQGYGGISDEVKCRIAAALNFSVWALFPDVKREVDLYNILIQRHGRDLVIRDDEIAMFKEVLSRATEEQFERLIWSGTDPADVHKIIRRLAKEMNIEVAK